MSKQTALQIAMRITQRYANSLFDEHTARGRQFMQEMSECLELEREQIEDAYYDGQSLNAKSVTSQMIIDNSISYYNEIYKGGEQ
jgi:hypothetical protein